MAGPSGQLAHGIRQGPVQRRVRQAWPGPGLHRGGTPLDPIPSRVARTAVRGGLRRSDAPFARAGREDDGRV